MILGSIVGFFFLVNSKLWLWELNENWHVKPVAEFISNFPDDQIYISNSHERPSLNWYSKKRIKTFEDKKQSKCISIKETNDWDLYTCND